MYFPSGFCRDFLLFSCGLLVKRTQCWTALLDKGCTGSTGLVGVVGWLMLDHKDELKDNRDFDMRSEVVEMTKSCKGFGSRKAL
jgi:hypothetical protein